MSERFTSASVPGIASGIADYGRKTRAEMVAQYRRYYERQKAEALEALAVPDDEILVETFTGIWVQRNKTVVTE